MLAITTDTLIALLGLVLTLAHFLGLASAIHALLWTRTSQGAIAWGLFLLTFPYVALPLYWVFGRAKYRGYVDARRIGDLEIHEVTRKLREDKAEHRSVLEGDLERFDVLQRLAMMPFTRGNEARLLVDGEATFEALFAGIDQARDYVLVQFFIVKADRIGQELKRRLLERMADGVRVYFLFDEVGSHRLSSEYIAELRARGAEVRPFGTTRGFRNRFQLNFRNHRKVVVVDGHCAFVGGLNVGDEYLGRDMDVGPWRDTHLEVRGPAVVATQLAFLEDWYWASHKVPKLCWQPRRSENKDQHLLVLPTGPADELETCSLFFVHCIHAARERIWIASPYFVPDREVLSALQLAALRGVDVRILLPRRPDHALVWLASFSFYREAVPYGVRIFRYEPAFLHQKVFVVDDDLATVGTANLDNRSLRLNFELSMVVADKAFAGEVADMLARDFEHSREATMEELADWPLYYRVGVRLARLMSPIL